MEHGYRSNDAWFVFANVSDGCPVCVQYLARSTFVVSSLRPAFARVFPSAREDLAAETFFHTRAGSNLLRGITDDDIITWFGTNGAEAENGVGDGQCAVNRQKKVNNTTNADINEDVDLDIDKVIIEPAVAPANGSTQTKGNARQITTDIADEIILQVLDVEQSSGKQINRNTHKVLAAQVDEEKSDAVNFRRKNVENTTEDEQLVQNTKFAKPTQPNRLIKKSRSSELAVDVNVSPPKRVNTARRAMPATASGEDVPSAKFAPENKDDRYVLLDREVLWDMLREAVDARSEKHGVAIPV